MANIDAMQTPAQEATPLSEPRWATIDPSSWIGWSCFGAGLLSANPAAFRADVYTGGLGAIIVGLGVVVFLLAVVVLQRCLKRSLDAMAYDLPTRLATSGPFRYSRNPIYVAFLAPIASISVYSVPAAIATAIIYMTLVTVVVIRAEERVLAARFGAEYEAYRANTPRWFLGV